MNSKLTLKLDKNIIEKAKTYANQKQSSLSRLVEDYFRFLAEKNKEKSDGISPLVKELSGIINLDEEFDLDREYTDFIVKKYQ